MERRQLTAIGRTIRRRLVPRAVHVHERRDVVVPERIKATFNVELPPGVAVIVLNGLERRIARREYGTVIAGVCIPRNGRYDVALIAPPPVSGLVDNRRIGETGYCTIGRIRIIAYGARRREPAEQRPHI